MDANAGEGSHPQGMNAVQKSER